MVALIFLKRSLVFPILLLFSVSLHWSLRKAFLSLLVILWNAAFKWVYLSFSPLPFTSPIFTTLCKASRDNHFAFLHFFFLGMVLITASCTMSRTSVHDSSGTLSDLIPWICLSLDSVVHTNLLIRGKKGSTVTFVSLFVTLWCLFLLLLCPTLATPWTESTRLLCPWDFPDKSTRVACHFLLHSFL